MTFSLRRVVAAAIPLAVLASTSLASDAQQFGRIYRPFAVRPYATGATTLGGGATLPIPGYLGLSESSGTTSFGKTGSLFGYFASVANGLNVAYCATGSGKGKGVFDGAVNTVDTPCSNAVSGTTATVFGFLPPSGTPRQSFPTLAGTDAPLGQSDYSLYTMDHASPAEPVELPSIFGAIAIYYNHAGVTGRANITTTKLCGIYNSKSGITTFGQLFGTSDTTTFTPVYRSDSSGTTFNFSNHLATVCSGGGYNGSQITSGTTQPLAFPNLPATAVGQSGNGGVVKYIGATANTVGYAEAGYLTPAIAGTLPANSNYATIDGQDPIKNLPEAANSVAGKSLTANVAVVQGTGPATTATLSGVRSGSCVQVVPPSAYARVTTGYSIVAVTYLLINHTGNGSAGAADLKNLEAIINTPADFKNPTSSAPITTIDQAEPATRTGAGTTGYSSLGTSFSSLKTTANICIGA